MTTTMPAGHYDRTDETKNYERHLFLSGKVLQSAELNELQRTASFRQKSIGDALFKDGDVIRDCRIVVDGETGLTKCESGAAYAQGAVRGIPPAEFTIPVTGTVVVGIRLIESVVTPTEDAELRDPAVGLRNFNEAGADRLKVEPSWGFVGDGIDGAIYPVYYIDDCSVRLKEPPPNLDAVSQALARYDRDSTGGVYVVDGLGVSFVSTDSADKQIYSLAEGRAYVEGFPVTFQTARRIVYEALPETTLIASEPHLSTSALSHRVDVNHPAISSITNIQVTNQKTVTMTHGAFAGAADMLPDPSVIELVSVVQGGTTYVPTTDYTLGSGTVDWSPAGAEPATGSTYSVTYKWIKTVTAETPDLTGFNVTGALTGTLILVTYQAKMPRYDRLCLATGGQIQWIKGVPSLINPVAPTIPSNLLPLATIFQTWLDGTRTVKADGPSTVSMAELSRINDRLDEIYQRVAEHRLLSDISVRDQGIQRGIFVDPFLDDLQRDAGIAQTAAIVAGELVLAVPSAPYALTADVTVATRCASYTAADVNQYQRTGSMKINPYGSQIAPPVAVSISPAIDRWTETATTWASPTTERLTTSGYENNPYYWRVPGDVTTTAAKNLGTTNQTIWYLRQIGVTVSASGFAPGEQLARLTFDGIDVTPVSRPVANGSGVIAVGFTIPANVPAGTKRCIMIGANGSYGEASFFGEGTRQVTSMQQVTTIQPNYVLSFTDPNKGIDPAYSEASAVASSIPSMSALEWTTKQRIAEINGATCVIDPLAQTFRATRRCQLSAVQLVMTAMGTKPVVVQIRTTTNGFPSGNILAESRLTPSGGVPQTVTFNFPIPAELFPNTEYALVVLSDDQTHEVGISELGKFDAVTGRWVTSQPYDIGVLLSSSNAQTWTAHNDRDLNFTTYRANYTEAQKTVNLGHVTVAGATDLLLLANGVSLSAAATVTYTLTFPDSSTMAAADGQRISLPAAVTGNIGVTAKINSNTDLSGILYPGSIVVAGAIASTGDYVSRAITCNAADRLTVIYDAVIPAGATVAAFYQIDGTGAWTAVTAPTGRPADFGAVEYTSVTTGLPAGVVRVKLVLTGTAAARPKVRKLRAMVTV